MALTLNNTIIARVAAGMYGLQLGSSTMDQAVTESLALAHHEDDGTIGISRLMNALYQRDFASQTDAAVAATLVSNLGITLPAHVTEARAIVEAALGGAAPGTKGAVIVDLINQFSGLTANPFYGAYATAFNTQISAAVAYSTTGTSDRLVSSLLPIFELDATKAAGVDVMRLTGNQDVRIDFTNPANQVVGLDIDGDGTIEFDGKERSVTGVATGFEIVDAYSRSPLNHKDTANNFLGDIEFDGTAFDGDGVTTDGNIFLGGLGVDKAFGGVGNDFLTGGGIAQGRAGTDVLSGGRNADFFFAEFSGLDATDGSSLAIDGGNTADDKSAGNGQSAQDNDWLLFEASDDDEPVQIWLNDDNVGATEPGDGILDSKGRALSRSGESMVLDDVENIDASGNLYGLLDDVNVEIGGRAVDSRDKAGDANYGIGTSAQLNIVGSNAGNTVIAGYDNDFVDGGAGNDLLFGGNLQQLRETVDGGVTNPNLAAITNDGRDELFGGKGNDNVALELDKGIADGGDGADTLWITNYSVGRAAATEAASAAALLSDGKIRIDLGYASYKGYRGDTLGENTDHSDEANSTSTSDHVAGTADQSNYVGSTKATTVTTFESVIATGLGGIDYKAAGANTPDLTFTNQQNFFGTAVDLELRGTDGSTTVFQTTGITVLGDFSAAQVTSLYASYVAQLLIQNPQLQPITRDAFEAALINGGVTVDSPAEVTTVGVVRLGDNTLYAGAGDDILEGRSGDDMLSGGAGNDDFVFQLDDSSGDGVDVIHRQTDLVKDAAATNLTDGTFGRDFGLESTQAIGVSVLQVSIAKVGGNAATDELSDVVNFVNGITTGVKVGNTFEKVELSTDAIKSATTYTGLVDALNLAIAATPFAADLNAVLQPDGVTIFITDAQGRELADSNAEVVGAGVVVNQKANTQTQNVFTFGAPEVEVSQDRIIYKSYEERLDNEGVDDDAVLGSTISLGSDAYANDLVVDFAADGTRLAEDQEYAILFSNLAVEDKVTVAVNGVKYQLQVGVNVDGSLIAGELNNAFVARLAGFINSFLDDDTAAGALNATASLGTLLLTQRSYNDGEETVFMRTPVVTLENLSGGQIAVSTVTNISQHEVHLLDFDGRNGALNRENVLFVGEEFTNRSVLETADADGGALNGSDSMVVYVANNSAVDNIKSAAADEGLQGTEIAFNAVANLATQFSSNFSVHGDDLLIGGDKADTIKGGTGDDRVHGSRGTDSADGGKDLYLVDGVIRVLNNRDAELVDELLTTVSIEPIAQTETGFGLVPGFADTLLFQQSDFGAVGAGGARFYVTLDSDVNQPNGGAGTVKVTEGAVQTGTTTFTNFEHIRTASGDGTLKGQGVDTLDFADLSTKTGGVFYNLSNDTALDDNQAGDGDAGGFSGFPGSVNLSAAGPGSVVINFGDDLRNLSDDSVTPTDATDDINPNDIFVADGGADDELYAVVDGVENIIGGLGDDGVFVDETEAGKDNVFSLGLGTDVVIYGNGFDNGPHIASSQVPTVTLQVNTGADTDTILQTGGRVGVDTARDTLTGVEVVSFATDGDNLDGGGAAASSRENDVLDVSRINGATVDYTNGYITSGGVTELGGVTQLIVFGAAEFETVQGSGGADALIISDDMVNSREDVGDGDNDNDDNDGLVGRDVTFDSYLNYDFVNDALDNIKQPSDADTKADDVDGDGAVYDRMSIAELRVIGRTGLDINPFGQNDIPEVLNQGEYQFKLGAGQDTVDYSDETGLIAAVVNFNPDDDKTGNPTRVLVSQSNTSVFNDEAGDRVDVLDSVERIVASQGTSIIDLTNSTTASSVLFSFGYDAKNRTTVPSLDRDIHTVRITGANSVVPLENLDLLEYRGEDLNADKSVDQADALWTTVEGSDFNEYVQLTGWEDGQNRTINLRGGNNEVNYNERTRGILLDVLEVDTEGGTEVSNNQFLLNVFHLNETGALGGGVDTITGHNKQHNVAVGTMRIEASQGDDDRVELNDQAATFLVGRVEGGDDVVDVLVDGTDFGMTLSGFEFLTDGTKNDNFTITDLSNFVNQLTLIDEGQLILADADPVTPGDQPLFLGSDDRDTIKLTNGSFETAVIRAPISHVLTVNNDLRMGDQSANDLQWLGLNDLRERLDDDFDPALGTNSVGFDFQVLDISEVTAISNLKATAVAGLLNSNDEVIVGDLTKIDGTATGGFTGFNVLSFTNATAGTGFKLDVVNDDLLNGSNLKQFEIGSITSLDFSRITDSRAVNASVVDNPANVVDVTLIGGNGADVLTGGRGNDTFTGGKGADVLDGGVIGAVGATYTVNLPGVGTTSGAVAGGSITIAGVTLTSVVGAPVLELDIALNQNYAQIADRFEAVSLATWKASLAVAGLSIDEANALLSVSHDGSSGNLVFTFSTAATTLSGLDPVNPDTVMELIAPPSVTADAVLVANVSETVFIAQAESQDTFVFEAKAADNGADTINNFNAADLATDDLLDFTAFLGGAADPDLVENDFAVGLDLTGDNVGIVFNKASALTGTDIALATGADVAGKIGVANNGKVVVLTTADANGASDVTNDAYKVYFVEDTNTGAGQTFVVTLVGTINSTTELNAADLLSAANGGDIFV